MSSHLTLDYLVDYGVGDTFVETGTYMGDTVELALEAEFSRVHSTELDPTLFGAAVSKFCDNPQVSIWLGDSALLLPEIVSKIKDPATFWLDAHASGPLPGGVSGGSPVLDELKAIAASPIKTHTIFIDDVRLFGSEEWSGVKLEDALAILKQINPDYQIVYLDGHINNDVLVATVRV